MAAKLHEVHFNARAAIVIKEFSKVTKEAS